MLHPIYCVLCYVSTIAGLGLSQFKLIKIFRGGLNPPHPPPKYSLGYVDTFCSNIWLTGCVENFIVASFEREFCLAAIS